jgi:2-iminobutanoate/2-iminopropanoate deaminase
METIHIKRGKKKMKNQNIQKKHAVSTPEAPTPLGRYSQAIIANNTVYVQGTLGIDPTTGKLAGNTIEEQTVQALKNINAILEAAGSEVKNIVKTTVFLSSLENSKQFNQVYERFFKDNPPPARTTVEARLPLNALVEIEAIAIL